jgi:hypothetical protein
MEDRNIAMLARKSWCGKQRIGFVDSNVYAAVQETFGEPTRTIDTRMGLWEIRERRDYVPQYFIPAEKPEPVSEFCAVYERDGVPRTLFTGDLEHSAAVEPTIDVLTRNVLEENGLWRGITEEKAFKKGAIAGGAITAGFLVPLFAFSMTGISALEYFEIKAKGSLSVTCQLAAHIGIMAGALYAPLWMGALMKYAGRKLDKKRTSGLPDEAESFLFGEEAECAIYDELDIAEEEARKSEMFKMLRSSGSGVSKEQFLKSVYIFMDPDADPNEIGAAAINLVSTS